MKKIILPIALLLIFIAACNKTPAKPEPKLINKAEITEEIKTKLTEAGLNTDGEIEVIYTSDDLKKDAVFVTKKLIAGHKEGEIYGCDLISIYDIAHSHSYDTTNESSVTVYLKDNTDFSVKFPGAIDLDEPFFKTLKTSWRDAISTAQKEIEK